MLRFTLLVLLLFVAVVKIACTNLKDPVTTGWIFIDTGNCDSTTVST